MNITAEIIERARRCGACDQGLAWAKEKPRTLSQLVRRSPAWPRWLAINVPLDDLRARELERLIGARAWWRDGERHRDDGPAVELANGTREWYSNGKLHRPDGPAIEWANGTKEWYREGKLHRDDGPAVEWPDGSREWYRRGKRHRTAGPAVEQPDGRREWWRNGKRWQGPKVRKSRMARAWKKRVPGRVV